MWREDKRRKVRKWACAMVEAPPALSFSLGGLNGGEWAFFSSLDCLLLTPHPPPSCTRAGGFFSSMFSRLFGEKERRILILGLDGAGKTTILYRLQVGEVVSTIPSTLLGRGDG